MPKKSSAAKNDNKKAPKPYDRRDKSNSAVSSSAVAIMNGAPSSSKAAATTADSEPLAASQLEFAPSLPAKAPGSSRRRSKKRKHLPESGNDAAGAEPESVGPELEIPTVPVTVKPAANGKRNAAASSSKPRSETAEHILARHKNDHAVNVASQALQTAFNREKEEHAEVRRELREVQDKAASDELELKRRVQELEEGLEENRRNVLKQRGEIESQTKMITDHTKHHDEIKENLSCGVCFDIFEDPHVVSCGHTACRKCFVQWFRSANAYRGEDIEAVLDGEDLTYRTKICHMCREPVLSRPVRMFALQSVIETLGLAPRHIDEERNEDHWALTFPPDPVSYMIVDEADGVNRCPACGCEIVGGNCEGCEAAFSDEDGEGIDDLGSMDELEDSDNDVLLGLPGLLPGQLGPIPYDPRLDVALNNFIDNLADDDDDDEDGGEYDEEDDFDDDDGYGDEGDVWGDQDEPLPRHRRPPGPVLQRRYDFSDDSDNEVDPVPEDILRHGLEYNRWGSDESDDEDFRGGRRQFSPIAPRRTRGVRDRGVIDLRSPSPPASPPHRQRVAPAVATQEELQEDEDYESSFIDDDDGVEDAVDSEAEVDDAAGLSGVEDDDASVPDVPTIDELRQRRAARFAAPRSPSQSPPPPSPPQARAPVRRSRRVISVSDSDD